MDAEKTWMQALPAIAAGLFGMLGASLAAWLNYRRSGRKDDLDWKRDSDKTLYQRQNEFTDDLQKEVASLKEETRRERTLRREEVDREWTQRRALEADRDRGWNLARAAYDRCRDMRHLLINAIAIGRSRRASKDEIAAEFARMEAPDLPLLEDLLPPPPAAPKDTTP